MRVGLMANHRADPLSSFAGHLPPGPDLCLLKLSVTSIDAEIHNWPQSQPERERFFEDEIGTDESRVLTQTSGTTSIPLTDAHPFRSATVRRGVIGSGCGRHHKGAHTASLWMLTLADK